MIIQESIVLDYCKNVRGVLHIGAYACEEAPFYDKITKNVVWVEANPELVDQNPNIQIINACISDIDNEQIWFNITNNGQSSSLLELKDHLVEHPTVHVVKKIPLSTKTIKTLYTENSIKANFLNIDIQGVELKALKGAGTLLNEYDYIYTEVNTKELYKDCALVGDIDDYLKQYNFLRVETVMSQYGWGDALYVKVPNDIPVYWINLEHRSDRFSSMVQQFQAQNIKNTRIVPPQNNERDLYCKAAKAHVKSILTAYQNGDNMAIIMEDDLDMRSGLGTGISYWKFLPEGWDVFQMHYIEPRLINALSKSSPACPNIVLKGYFASCACYMINRRGMRKLLNVLGRFDNNGHYTTTYVIQDKRAKAEELVFRYVNTYCCLYPLFNTFENFKSDINVNNEYMKRNYNNMLAINKLFDIPIPSKRVVKLPYHLHWLSSECSPEEFLQFLFNKKKILYSFLHSGLGDRLFQYCSIYGMAKLYNLEHRVFCSHTNKHAEYFSTATGRPIPCYDEKDLQAIIKYNGNDVLIKNNLIDEYIAICLNPEPYKHERYPLLTNRAYIFDGLFHNEKYFYKYRTDILERFREPQYITKLFDEKTAVLASNIICIHVKSAGDGDFVNLLNYYIEAMKFAKDLHPDCLFTIVVGDLNPDASSLYHCLKGIPLFVNNTRNELVDLYFMARCKGVICSNSTLAWWGAWLNQTPNKFVTIPSKWSNVNNKILQMCGAHIIDI